MSHLNEREEKNCLNCQAEVQGRYCSVCGQENIEPKESFWHLITHFTYDVTHFDGKFFSTLRYLLFKPGFLSHEYLRGRRASYLHPIRMYVFTSALFFLIFFSTRSEDEGVMTLNNSRGKPATAAAAVKKLEKRKKNVQAALDGVKTDTGSKYLPEVPVAKMLVALSKIDSDLVRISKDTTLKDSLLSDNNNYNFMGGTVGTGYRNVNGYDSTQATLPEAKRDNWLERKFVRQNLYLKEKYKNDESAMWKAIVKKFNHLFPQMLFVSLPLFALLLKLLYVRRKKFYYVNHVIFTIHLYCGTFIMILAAMAIDGIFKLFHSSLPGWLSFIFVLTGLFYWYKSLRNFYEQRRGKTVLKYCLIMFLGLIVMSLIFAAFFIFSALTI